MNPIQAAAKYLSVIQVIIFVTSFTFRSAMSNSGCAECGPRKLLIISFDGFRVDYINKSPLKNLTSFHKMIADGAWAYDGIRSQFITKTFPNHYSIATGLHEESHGIVGNVMYDSKFNATFRPEDKEAVSDARWYNGEPIWVTNQMQNTQHRSGSMMWPSTLAPIKGFLPYRLLPFNPDMPYEDRVDTIVDWFLGDYPINLGMLYIQDPDHTAHTYGPDSWEVLHKIVELDQLLDRLFWRLKDNDLFNQMDIILTSDHGMTSENESLKIDLNKYITFDSYFVTSTNPVAAIFPKSKELEDEIFKNLSGIPHTHVYRKTDIPVQYHYKNNRRSPPILLEPDEHYWVSYNNSKSIAGEHGYNNSLHSMHPFFIAMGPSFKKSVKVKTFDNVDIYPLMCKLLNLKPAPNNGSLATVSKLLVPSMSQETGSSFIPYIFIILFTSLLTSIFCIAACRVQRQFRRRQLKVRTLFGPDKSYREAGDLSMPLMSDNSEEEFNVP